MNCAYRSSQYLPQTHFVLTKYHKFSKIVSRVQLYYWCIQVSPKVIYTHFFVGYKIQIVGSFESVRCERDRYQPITYWTNSSGLCKFKKSACTGEGQIPFSLGTNKLDSSCRCDYTQGYDFVVRPTNTCFCMPAEEDCSCFIRQCPIGFVLSPGKTYLQSRY